MTTWLDDFQQAINSLDANLVEYLSATEDVDEVLAMLVRMHDLKAQVSMVYGTAEHGASSLMQDGVEYRTGSKIIEKKSGNSRKAWQHDKLAQTVVERLIQLATNEETGEVELSPGQMAEKLLGYAHTDYWRVKPLQDDLNINADMYCEQGDSRTSVSVRKA